MMWPRYCEMLLALWLAAAPWVLNYDAAVNVAAAAVILLLDVLSVTFYKPYAFLAVLPIAAVLLLHAYFALPVESAGTQNNILVALLLLMFAILPSAAALPPNSWREFHKRRP